jgi:hypothetical protein
VTFVSAGAMKTGAAAAATCRQRQQQRVAVAARTLLQPLQRLLGQAVASLLAWQHSSNSSNSSSSSCTEIKGAAGVDHWSCSSSRCR